jgi:ATP-dependent DNA helicase PIF1
LTAYQQKAIKLVQEGKVQVMYITGKAGTGKTEVAKHLCNIFKGRVQAGAGTGKAAMNYNGSTVHKMFGLSFNEKLDFTRKQKKLAALRTLYSNVNLFIIDEINASSAGTLAMIDAVMEELFAERDRKGKIKASQKRFGGKQMVFLGDAAQLRPINGAAIYDESVVKSKSWKRRKVFNSSIVVAYKSNLTK